MEFFNILQSTIDNLGLYSWTILKVWWWLILPLLFYFPAKFFYLWWIHWEIWYKEMTWIMLEIIPPSEVQKPYMAMEDFFNSVWPTYDSPNWRETWCEGELVNGPFWTPFEITSIAGEIHFYMRIVKEQKPFFEAILHAHYPDVELIEVEDYTQAAPRNVPSKDYEMYGEDFVLFKEDPYPIKTYKYFEIKPEEIEQEKKLDPFSSLLEAMAKLGEGEQLWFQIIVTPITDEDVPWVTEGKKIKEKLARRVNPPAPDKSIARAAFDLMVHDKMPFEQAKQEESVIPPEMKLTPGEREVLAAVENKITKHGFRTTIRSIYIARRDKYFSPTGKIPRAYFMHFNTQNLNGIRFWGQTRTKIHYFFRKRRLYVRKRNILKRYINRFPPLYPKRTGPGTMVLNAEELATIFHLPNKAALLPPGVPRTAVRRGVPPASVPFDTE